MKIKEVHSQNCLIFHMYTLVREQLKHFPWSIYTLILHNSILVRNIDKLKLLTARVVLILIISNTQLNRIMKTKTSHTKYWEKVKIENHLYHKVEKKSKGNNYSLSCKFSAMLESIYLAMLESVFKVLREREREINNYFPT